MFKVKNFPCVETLISHKSDGNVDPRFSPNFQIHKHLEKIANKINSSLSDIVQMEQVHACRVIKVSEKHKGKIVPHSDGLITNIPNLVLMLRVADCISVLLVDPINKAIGLVHSGWKGTIGKITLVALQKMMREYGTNPSRVHLYLGPSIQKCCYLTKDPLQAELPEWQKFIQKKGDQLAIDLPGFVKETALQAGVQRMNINSSHTCTVMDQNFFSFQRSLANKEKEGRFAVMIKLRN